MENRHLHIFPSITLCSYSKNKQKSRNRFVILTLPIPGFVSVVGLVVFELPGDGGQFVPGLPPDLIDLERLMYGELLIC